MHEAWPPLGRKAGTTLIHRVCHHGVIVQVLSDRDSVRAVGSRVSIDPLHEAPAVRQYAALIAVAPNAANPGGRVETKSIHMIFVQPHQGVVPNELPHFLPAVIRASHSPGRFGTPVVIEINAALAVFAPAVELPQIQIARPEVVIDDIQNHPDTGLMRSFHEPLEPGCTAVIRFHRENARRVVSP
jgi:hypothetical protein